MDLHLTMLKFILAGGCPYAMVAVTMHHFSGLDASFVRSKGTVSCGMFSRIKEEVYLDFDLAHSNNVPAPLGIYVRFVNRNHFATTLSYKSLVHCTERGF